ncbi:MAG: hypothetical protein KY464_06460 [Gemmatimonadetes bacterium]|nr:hypothetical protein [Gemmatimonadota bacterium]
MRAISSLTLIVGLAVLPGCAGGGMGGMGGLGGILGSVLGGAMGGQGGQQQQSQQVQAEIQEVDARNSRMSIRTQQGEGGWVRFDQQTVVVYRQQQYPVTALERGDVVNLQLQQMSRNEVYVSRVDVVQSVQERQGR